MTEKVQIVERGRKIHEEKRKRRETRAPPRFPGVQLNSLPTHRHTLLTERLEQAIKTRDSEVIHVTF